MNKAIAITLYRRPDYTEQLFDALSKCYGIEEYNVSISCDYAEQYGSDCDAVFQMALEFTHSTPLRGSHVWSNNPRLGVDLNKLAVMPDAFEISPYVIFLEDDTPPAKDALRYFEAMRVMFRTDPTIVSISGYNRYLEAEEHERVLRDEPYHIDRGTQFCAWGWAMFEDMYTSIIGMDGEKYKKATGEQANGLFDHNICQWMEAHQPAYTIYPVLGRTNHTGKDRAEHTPSEVYLMENEYAPFTAASQDMPDCKGVNWIRKW